MPVSEFDEGFRSSTSTPVRSRIADHRRFGPHARATARSQRRFESGPKSSSSQPVLATQWKPARSQSRGNAAVIRSHPAAFRENAGRMNRPGSEQEARRGRSPDPQSRVMMTRDRPRTGERTVAMPDRPVSDGLAIGQRISLLGRAKWDGGILYVVGQAFQPDVRLESLTYACAIRSACALRNPPRSGPIVIARQDGQPHALGDQPAMEPAHVLLGSMARTGRLDQVAGYDQPCDRGAIQDPGQSFQGLLQRVSRHAIAGRARAHS